ncbi:TonB-dependent siderophore receptor, partial [Bacillus sp. SIMBA_026]
VKLDLGRLGATFSAFQITQPSGLSTASRTGGLPVFGVDGEQRNRGLELYGYGELTEGLRLLGGVMVLDAVQTKTAGGVNNG